VNESDATSELVPAVFTAAPDGWRFGGAITLFNAESVYRSTLAAPLPESGVVDFAAVTHADSAALALVMELQRRAGAEGHSLVVRNLSPALLTLAVVYGVEGLVAPPVT
jgi:phospholipid transport system transporter-binding protein